MKLYQVTDPEFVPYGKVLEGYDTAELVAAMEQIPLPANGTEYAPSIESLEECAIYREARNRAYGGMPIQIGMCWGHNSRLNCLEYHRDSEVNIGSGDFILLLAKQDQIVDGMLDTALVKAFLAPAGVAVEVYATTMHYAPCQRDGKRGFRVAVILPDGTNTGKPAFEPKCREDRWMTARNKWLLAHADAPEAAAGAYVGLKGENIDLSVQRLAL